MGDGSEEGVERVWTVVCLEALRQQNEPYSRQGQRARGGQDTPEDIGEQMGKS